MNHNKDNLLEALKLDVDSHVKITKALELLKEKNTLEVSNLIDSYNIVDADYHVCIFAFSLLYTTKESTLERYLIEKEKQTVNITIETIREQLISLMLFFQTSIIDKPDMKFAILLLSIILFFSTKLIPLSLCVETITKIVRMHKLSTENIINGAAVAAQFVDPLVLDNFMH